MNNMHQLRVLWLIMVKIQRKNYSEFVSGILVSDTYPTKSIRNESKPSQHLVFGNIWWHVRLILKNEKRLCFNKVPLSDGTSNSLSDRVQWETLMNGTFTSSWYRANILCQTPRTDICERDVNWLQGEERERRGTGRRSVVDLVKMGLLQHPEALQESLLLCAHMYCCQCMWLYAHFCFLFFMTFMTYILTSLWQLFSQNLLVI